MERWVASDEAVSRASVGAALGAEGFALNRYRLPPGKGLPSGLHTHLDQEEVFVVLSGELRFETLEGDVTVGEGEAIRFAPGEYQTGANVSESETVVLAVGTPRESEEVRVPLDCPDCGETGLEPNWRDDEVVLDCPACGAGHRTRGCPACDRPEMKVAPDDGGTVVVCPDCGAERSTPVWK